MTQEPLQQPPATTGLIPVGKLIAFDGQDRTVITADSLDQIKPSFRHRISQGLLPNIEPLHVTPSGDDRYVIHAGERRWLAAVEIGYEGPLLCLIHSLTPNQKSDVMLLSNFSREELNLIDLSNAIGTRIDSGLWDRKKAMELIGYDKTALSRLLALRTLPPEVQKIAKDDLRRDPKFLIRLSTIPEPTLSYLVAKIRSNDFEMEDLIEAEMMHRDENCADGRRFRRRLATKLSMNSEALRLMVSEAPNFRRLFKQECRGLYNHSRLHELGNGEFLIIFRKILKRMLEDSERNNVANPDKVPLH